LIRPTIYRKEEGSVGGKIVEMISSKLERLDASLIVKQVNENEITISTKNKDNSIKFRDLIIQKINSL